VYSDAIAEHLSARLGGWFVPLAFAWLLIVPAALFAAAAWWWRRPHAPAAPILLLGVAVGAWASAAWLCIPYCGVYPNLPGAALGALAFGVGTAGQEAAVHVTNFILWPAAAAAALRVRVVSEPTPLT
jgi:hypothetical protein